jgi:hypothetical protein
MGRRTVNSRNKFTFLPWPRAITRRTQSRYGRDALDQTRQDVPVGLATSVSAW